MSTNNCSFFGPWLRKLSDARACLYRRLNAEDHDPQAREILLIEIRRLNDQLHRYDTGLKKYGPRRKEITP